MPSNAVQRSAACIVRRATVILLLAQIARFPDRTVQWLLAGLAAATFLGLPLLVRCDAIGLGDVDRGRDGAVRAVFGL